VDIHRVGIMPAVLATRLALLAVALAAAGWFALSAHEGHDERAAARLVAALKTLSPADARRAADDLDGASTLDPDTHVDVLRAELALHRDDLAAARRILQRVVAREPEAIEAWAVLADALKRADPAAAARARAQLRRLAPPVPAP
jgi:Tfp pilus assembly protein PilF